MADNDLDQDDLPPPIGPHRRHPIWAPLDILGNVTQGLFVGVVGVVKGVGRGLKEGFKDLSGDSSGDEPPKPPAPKAKKDM